MKYVNFKTILILVMLSTALYSNMPVMYVDKIIDVSHKKDVISEKDGWRILSKAIGKKTTKRNFELFRNYCNGSVCHINFQQVYEGLPVLGGYATETYKEGKVLILGRIFNVFEPPNYQISSREAKKISEEGGYRHISMFKAYYPMDEKAIPSYVAYVTKKGLLYAKIISGESGELLKTVEMFQKLNAHGLGYKYSKSIPKEDLPLSDLYVKDGNGNYYQTDGNGAVSSASQPPFNAHLNGRWFSVGYFSKQVPFGSEQEFEDPSKAENYILSNQDYQVPYSTSQTGDLDFTSSDNLQMAIGAYYNLEKVKNHYLDPNLYVPGEAEADVSIYIMTNNVMGQGFSYVQYMFNPYETSSEIIIMNPPSSPNSKYDQRFDSAVYFHEYGHLVFANAYLYTMFYKPKDLKPMNEGHSDYVAYALLGDCGQQCGYNNYINAYDGDHYWGGHQKGNRFKNALAGARNSIGPSFEKTVVDALKAEPLNYKQFLETLLFLDDDNGNLEDGTPHIQEICDSFYLQKIYSDKCEDWTAVPYIEIYGFRSGQSVPDNLEFTVEAKPRSSDPFTILRVVLLDEEDFKNEKIYENTVNPGYLNKKFSVDLSSYPGETTINVIAKTASNKLFLYSKKVFVDHSMNFFSKYDGSILKGKGSSVSLADLNGNGEFVLGVLKALNGSVYLDMFNSSGKKTSSYLIGEYKGEDAHLYSEDIDSDGKQEFVIYYGDGMLSAFGDSGKELEQNIPMSSQGISGEAGKLSIGFVDGNTKPDAVMSFRSNQGDWWLVEYSDFKNINVASGDSIFGQGASINGISTFDIDNDGKDEIMLTANVQGVPKIAVLKENLNVMSVQNLPGSEIVGDLKIFNTKNGMFGAYSDGQKVYVVDENLNLISSSVNTNPLKNPEFGVGDVDGNGIMDVGNIKDNRYEFADIETGGYKSSANYFQSFNPNIGASYKSSENTHWIVDLNGDGKDDILTVMIPDDEYIYDNQIVGFDSNGNMVFGPKRLPNWNLEEFSDQDVARKFLVFDIDRDGNNEIAIFGDTGFAVWDMDGKSMMSNKQYVEKSSLQFSDVGDVNNDGMINVVDVQCVINKINGKDTSLCQKVPNWMEDLNCDGEVNVVDVVALTKYSLGNTDFSKIDNNGDNIIDACEGRFLK